MSKSLQEFDAWALKQGQVGNPGSGSYLGQCVSLVQQYLNQVFDIPYAARGNAWSFVPPGFKQLPQGTSLKPGDIIRYTTAMGYGDGHIEYVGHDGRIIDQNGVKPLHIGVKDRPFNSPYAVFRPTKPFNVKKTGVKKMIDKNQLNVLFVFYKGTHPTAAQIKAYVGKKTFAQMQKQIISGADYKSKVKQAANGTLAVQQHLPATMRAVYKPPTAKPANVKPLSKGIYEVK